MALVLAVPGSLRRDSYNRRLLRAAAQDAPAGIVIEVYDELAALPLFDEDLERGPLPAAVQRLKARVAAADALLISSPEYNWSVPGVLKNAIDWLSRPPDEVLIGKPVAIVGASAGRWGTRLAQAALRQILTATESRLLGAPALFVREAGSVFAGDRLVDIQVRTQLRSVVEALARETAALRAEVGANA